MTPPETRYAKSGDIRIAYQVVGKGPFDLFFFTRFRLQSRPDMGGRRLGALLLPARVVFPSNRIR